jgi:hypothetical protein
MRSKIISFLLCLTGIAGLAVATIFTPYGTVELNVIGSPDLGKAVDLEVIVTSDVDAPETAVVVKLPEGVIPVNSATSWTEDLKAGIPASHRMSIKVVEEGIWEITVSSFSAQDRKMLIGIGDVILRVDAISGEATSFEEMAAESQTRAESMTEEMLSYQIETQYYDPAEYFIAEVIYEEPYSDDNESRGCDGYITVRGYFYYYDEWGSLQPVVNASTYIYDSDWPSGDDLLGQTITDWNGFFEVAGIENCDCWGCGTLDVYVKFKIWNTRFRVYSNGQDDVYTWVTATIDNVPAGVVDFGGQAVPFGDGNKKAVWTFQDMNEAWNYGTVYGHDPGDIRCKYPISDASYAYTDGSAAHPALMFISPKASDEREVVVHEYAHALMNNAGLTALPGGPHHLYQTVSSSLAFSEGHAHFFAGAVWGSPIIDVDPDDFWPLSEDYVNRNYETFAHVDGYTYDWPEDIPSGATNESRVAGALWDIKDYSSDGYDNYGYGFTTLYDIIWEDRPMLTLSNFWNAWKAGGRYGAPSYGAHGAVAALYNNTVDYNTRPSFSPTSENVDIFSLPANNVLQIESYASDAESPDSYLNFIINSTVPGGNPFSAVIDGSHYLDFNASWWYGSGTVTIGGDDELETTTNSFNVYADIEPVPFSPTLISPTDGHRTTNHTPTLKWHAVNGAGVDQYEVWVDNDPAFGSVDYQQSGSTDTTWTLPSLAHDWWYWKVRAHNSTGWGGWSDDWSFEIYHTGTGCPVLFTHDGAKYHKENPLLTACEKSGYVDIVTDYYHITRPIALHNGTVNFMIQESVDEISYIHDLELITVDHSRDVRIACATDGSISTYAEMEVPLSAVDNFGNDQLAAVIHEDGNLFSAKDPGHMILTFANNGDLTGIGITAFRKPDIIVDPGDGPKVLPGDPQFTTELTIEILDANGNWHEISSNIPARENPVQEIVPFDMVSGFDGDIFTLRVSWNGEYATDVIGQIIPSDEEPLVQSWRMDWFGLMKARPVTGEWTGFSVGDPLVLTKGDVFKFSFDVGNPEHGSLTRDYIIRAVGRYQPDYDAIAGQMPAQFQLYRNFPNPFNPATTIMYDLPEATHAKVDVYNVLGQHITTLVDRLHQAGHHQTVWNGRDSDDHPVASGIYIYRLVTDDFTDSRKMALLK